MISKEKLTLKKPSNTKTRFTRRFLASLSKMRRFNNNKLRSASSSSDEGIRRRSHRIKISSYSSMARAVGSKRVWSRAVLLKIRNRKMFLRKKKKVITKSKCRNEMGNVDKLRKLVPGGESMDLCGLLEETAHYMKCLATQVQVMQRIVDHYSNK